MRHSQAWPEQLVLRLDERSLRGFAKLQRSVGTLQVFVPYTTGDLTRTALGRAAVLARELGAQITLLAVEDKPAISSASLESKLTGVAHEAGTEADIRIVRARDPETGCKQILTPNSLVVMATRKRWWPTAEVKLAGALARAGHSVALLEV